MALDTPLVFPDVVEVVLSNNDSPVHLSTMAYPTQDTAPDRNIAGKWALLVDVRSWIKRKNKKRKHKSR